MCRSWCIRTTTTRQWFTMNTTATITVISNTGIIVNIDIMANTIPAAIGATTTDSAATVTHRPLTRRSARAVMVGARADASARYVPRASVLDAYALCRARQRS